MTPPSSKKVFLSYSSKDSNKARRLAQDLRSAHVDVWFDEFELKPGDPLLTSIRTAIEGASHLLVLISENSASSSWVQNELKEAFIRHGAAGSPTIIPIRIDGSPVPAFLQSVLYVDLREHYEAGFAALLRALEAGDERKRVSEVIDASDLAQDIAKDRPVQHGSGFLVSTVLSVLTIIATLVAALPAFYQVWGDRPRVYYAISQAALSIPASLDQAKIHTMLKDAGIADSNLRIAVLNRGARKASEIKIGVTVDGILSTFSSEPDEASKPVWVGITAPKWANGAKTTTFSLTDLVPNREFVAALAYFSSGEKFTCDVVADGAMAERVDSLATVPASSFWSALKTPLLILLSGIIISILAGAVIASAANKKFRDLLIEVVESINPLTGRVMKTLIKVATEGLIGFK